MGYNQNKDKLIKLFERKVEGENLKLASLLLSVFQYNSGPPKLQVTRSFDKADGTIGYGKMGRLTIEEVEWIKENIDSIISVMQKVKE